MRWIDKLSPKELLELHKSVVYDDTDGIDGIYRDRESNHINIDFSENWPYEDGMPNYMPTNYRYYDFDYEDCDTNGELNNGAYRTWLAKRFGKEYIKDMLRKKLGVNIEVLKELELEVKEGPQCGR